MSFPSPARDWWEVPLSLDDLCDIKNPAVFFFKYEGEDDGFVKKGAVLVVDRSLIPKKGDLMIVVLHGEMAIVPYEKLSKADRVESEGIVTHVLNCFRSCGVGS